MVLKFSLLPLQACLVDVCPGLSTHRRPLPHLEEQSLPFVPPQVCAIIWWIEQFHSICPQLEHFHAHCKTKTVWGAFLECCCLCGIRYSRSQISFSRPIFFEMGDNQSPGLDVEQASQHVPVIFGSNFPELWYGGVPSFGPGINWM